MYEEVYSTGGPEAPHAQTRGGSPLPVPHLSQGLLTTGPVHQAQGTAQHQGAQDTCGHVATELHSTSVCDTND